MTDKSVPGYCMQCESGTVSSETSEETRAMKNKETIRVVFERLEQIYTEPRSQLLGPIVDDPVDTLVATILSQATNDTLSSRAFSQLKSQFPQWEDLLCDIDLIIILLLLKLMVHLFLLDCLIIQLIVESIISLLLVVHRVLTMVIQYIYPIKE